MSYDHDDTELDLEDEATTEMALLEAYVDPVDAQIALVMLSASELAKHTPVADILPQVGSSLGELWSAAEASGNQTALLHIQTAWDSVNAIAAQAQAHGENAAAAIAALGTLKKQRDSALETIDELEGHIEYMEESAYGDFMQGIYDNGGHVLDMPDEDIWDGIYDNVEGLDQDDMPTADQCGQFFEYLIASPLVLPEALELIAFIKEFTIKVEARRKADWQTWQVNHNAKVDAMRAKGGAS